MKPMVMACAALVALSAAAGQDAPLPAFEVASVRPAQPENSDGNRPRSTGMAPALKANQALVDFRSVSVKGVLSRAYDLAAGEISGPAWLDENRYDIQAKPPQGATQEQIALMLRGLLAERFRMRVHWEIPDTAGYALVVDKSGSKLKKAAELAPGSSDNLSASMASGPGWVRIGLPRVSMGAFAKTLGAFLARPVVDMTDLPGMYELTLECSSDSLPGLPRTAAPANAELRPSIFSAMRELGLRLESQKVPTKRLIVDSADKNPTEN